VSGLRAILVGAVESSEVALAPFTRNPDWTLAAVVTLNGERSGRHSDFVDLEPAAARMGARVIRVDNVNHDASLAAIDAIGADYIFVVGWSQICGPRFLDLAPGRVIGYHPAALPRMRGRAAIPWTILNQEAITAGSLFWIDGGTDTGDLLDQHYFHVSPGETAASLYAKHMEALVAMLERSLVLLARGEAPRRPQDEACATLCARRTPADGRIDWAAPADDVLRLVRAVGRPYPGASTNIGSTPLTIWAAAPAPDAHRHVASPGQIVAVDADSFVVMCGARSAITVNEWSGSERRPPLHAVLGRDA
jgi:methionyl-tRNA formyltransferase